MFLMSKHVNEENSGYLQVRNFLFKPSKKPRIISQHGSGTSANIELILWLSKSCFTKKFFTHWKISFFLQFLFSFTLFCFTILVQSITIPNLLAATNLLYAECDDCAATVKKQRRKPSCHVLSIP